MKIMKGPEEDTPFRNFIRFMVIVRFVAANRLGRALPPRAPWGLLRALREN